MTKEEKYLLATMKQLYFAGRYIFEEEEENKYIAPKSSKTKDFIDEVGIDKVEEITDLLFQNLGEYVFDISEIRDKYDSNKVVEALIWDNVCHMVYVKAAIYNNLLYIVIHQSN